MVEALIVVGVPRETSAGETRVALVPGVVTSLVGAGLDVVVESGAGEAAGFGDGDYLERGARIGERAEVLAADAVVAVNVAPIVEPMHGHPDGLAPETVVVGLADPLASPSVAPKAAEHKVTLFALELLPRISRAQSMDVLSSQATLVGYKAVLLAAERLPKLFPMLTTAAGTIPPAQVFVIGAGVAGLQAIATARRLGAVVQAYDVRPAAQEDIESLGARAVLLPLAPGDAQDESGYAKELGAAFFRRQQELIYQMVASVDAVITTALIPGKRAPVLVTREAVECMGRGSVIVDCAAGAGGNCELSSEDETVITSGNVSILGPTNLAATMPHVASQMYAKNIASFLLNLARDGRFVLDEQDEIIRGTLVTRNGEVVHPRVLEALGEAGR